MALAGGSADPEVRHDHGVTRHSGHPTVSLRLGGQLVSVDEDLVPLMGALWRRGIRTRWCCQDAPSPTGLPWRAVPDERRCSVSFLDASDVRRFLAIVARSRGELSARALGGAERTWEFRVCPTAYPPVGRDGFRLQVTAYIPWDDVSSLAQVLAASAVACS